MRDIPVTLKLEVTCSIFLRGLGLCGHLACEGETFVNDVYTNELRHKVQRSTKGYRILLIAASIAQAVAVYFGLRDLLPGDGWGAAIIPLVAAPVIGVILYLIWDLLIGTVPLLHNPVSRALGGALGLVMAALTVAASSWFIAAAIGGDGAIAKHQQGYVTIAQTKLSQALANSKKEQSLATRAGDIATGWEGQADLEEKFGIKQPGKGPRTLMLRNAAKGMKAVEQMVLDRRIEVDRYQAQGSALIARMGKATDQKKFADDATNLQQLVSKMEATSALETAGKVGIISFGAADDEKARIFANEATQSLRKLAEEIEANREKVVLDAYVPITSGNAVIKYAGDAASAWVVGVAIDLVPFILLLAMMLLHAEARDPYTKRREFGFGQYDGEPKPTPPVTPLRAAE